MHFCTFNIIQFTRLCAGRIGQLLNYASLASDAGISPNTAKAWLSILESSYILYRLQPYHRNFNKRLVKSPKLYFYDTGIACSLLGIREENRVNLHYLKGGLFENLIINEFIKRNFHRGENRMPYFWQDNHGKEVDCLLAVCRRVAVRDVKYQLAPLRAQRTRSFNGFLGDLSALRGKKLTPIEFSDSLLVNGDNITPVEIKSGKTMSTSYFDNLQYWRQLTAVTENQGWLMCNMCAMK